MQMHLTGRRAARALRSRGHRDASARARALREPRDERHPPRSRATRAARAFASTTCSSACRTPTRASSDRIAGLASHAAKMRVAGVGEGARAAAHGERRPAPREPRSRGGRRRDGRAAVGADRLELANVQLVSWAHENATALLPDAGADRARARRRARPRRSAWRAAMEVVFVLPDWHADRPARVHGRLGDGASSSSRPTERCSRATRHAALPLPFESVRDGPLSRASGGRGEGMRAFRGEAWMAEPCKTCDRRDVDYGGCRCQAFALTGDARATDPACSLAPPARASSAQARARAEGDGRSTLGLQGVARRALWRPFVLHAAVSKSTATRRASLPRRCARSSASTGAACPPTTSRRRS